MKNKRQHQHTNGHAEDEPASNAVSHEKIAARAYELWMDDGRCEGKQEQHWLDAERELQQTSSERNA